MPVDASYSNVTVNLEVSISAEGEVAIFGMPEVPIVNPIYPSVGIPATDLYDGSYAMFEFQEGATRGERKGAVCVVGNDGRDGLLKSHTFANSLHAVLAGSMDCSAALPFSGYKNQNVAAFYEADNFGEVVLKLYAHHILGHVAATAAITNDVALVDAMLSSPYTNDTAAFSAAQIASLEQATGSTSDADLARRLVAKVLSKGNGTAAATKIAEQVLRDANRALNEDNNALAPGDWQALRFIPGDRICMQIKIAAPSVVVTAQEQLVSEAELEGRYPGSDDATKFTLVIDLE